MWNLLFKKNNLRREMPMKVNKHLATVMAATMVAGSVVPVMAETTNEALIGKIE